MRGFGKGIVCGLILVALGAASAADAQMRIKRVEKIEPLPKKDFAELRGQLGACILKHNEAMVAKLLSHSDSLTTDYAAMGVANPMFMFKLDQCKKYNVPQMMAPVFMKPGALRGLMLEASYLAAFKAAPVPLLDDKGQPALAPARTFASKGDQLASAQTFAAIADCAATNGADQADKVLRTGAGLPEEREAAIALAPVIGACLTEGQEISLTPDAIRALAAEGMWYRYGAAAAGQTNK